MNIGKFKEILFDSIAEFETMSNHKNVDFIFNPSKLVQDNFSQDKNLTLVIYTNNPKCAVEKCMNENTIVNQVYVYFNRVYKNQSSSAYILSEELNNRELVITDFLIRNSIKHHDDKIVFDFIDEFNNRRCILTNIIEGKRDEKYYFYEYNKPRDFSVYTKTDTQFKNVIYKIVPSLQYMKISYDCTKCFDSLTLTNEMVDI